MNVYVGFRLICRSSHQRWTIGDIRICPETGKEQAWLKADLGEYLGTGVSTSCPVECLKDFYYPAPEWDRMPDPTYH